MCGARHASRLSPYFSSQGLNPAPSSPPSTPQPPHHHQRGHARIKITNVKCVLSVSFHVCFYACPFSGKDMNKQPLRQIISIIWKTFMFKNVEKTDPILEKITSCIKAEKSKGHSHKSTLLTNKFV